MFASFVNKSTTNKFLILSILFLAKPTFAITPEQLTSLKDTIREMCLFPDKTGDLLKIDGKVQAGVPVPIRIIKGGISGRISYDTWAGIPITLDKYKTDPRQCAIEITKLLLPSFQPTEKTTFTISGDWSSNIGVNYKISQNGSNFNWDVIPGRISSEQGQGTVSGDQITAKWKGTNGSGSATGKISSTNGTATLINWSNGVVFTRIQ